MINYMNEKGTTFGKVITTGLRVYLATLPDQDQQEVDITKLDIKISINGESLDLHSFKEIINQDVPDAKVRMLREVLCQAKSEASCIDDDVNPHEVFNNAIESFMNEISNISLYDIVQDSAPCNDYSSEVASTYELNRKLNQMEEILNNL